MDIIRRSVFDLKHDFSVTEFSLRNIVYIIEGRTMDNVYNCVSFVNVP
jgi:hypothetical protein